MLKPSLLAVSVLAVATASCGGGSNQLRSIAISPAMADAQNFPNGQVQFVATGTFTNGSKAQVSALWTLIPPFTTSPQGPVPGWISLSSSGLAKCTGVTSIPNWPIYATAAVDTSVSPSMITMNTKTVSATAQLTCP